MPPAGWGWSHPGRSGRSERGAGRDPRRSGPGRGRTPGSSGLSLLLLFLEVCFVSCPGWRMMMKRRQSAVPLCRLRCAEGEKLVSGGDGGRWRWEITVLICHELAEEWVRVRGAARGERTAEEGLLETLWGSVGRCDTWLRCGSGRRCLGARAHTHALLYFFLFLVGNVVTFVVHREEVLILIWLSYTLFHSFEAFSLGFIWSISQSVKSDFLNTLQLYRIKSSQNIEVKPKVTHTHRVTYIHIT